MSYADRDRYGMYKDSTSAGPGPALMGADTLIGDSVVNVDDDSLGEIKEIMLDMNSGQVGYAVLAFGGFLGMGEKLFAVPWQALHLDTVNKRFVLNVDKERLKTAPGFNPDAWPDMSDISWANQVHTFYGTDPSRAGGPTMGPGATLSGIVPGGAGSGAGMGSAMGSSMGAGAAGSMGTGAGSAGSMGTGAGVAGSAGAAGSSGGAGSSSAAGSAGGAGTSSGSGSSTTGSSSAGMESGAGAGSGSSDKGSSSTGGNI
jgi:sporulation protein YlmC with PRC-barrel domain